MDIKTALETRRSIRAYLDKPVDNSLIIDAIQKAARAPSGGNVQPWKIYLLTGQKMHDFKQLMKTRLAGTPHPSGDTPEYEVYPPKLKEPYRSARYEVGEEMYALLSIPRENKPERLKWFTNNYQFFGAPAGIFCFTDRCMGPPQWSDLGMYLQSLMLLLRGAGLSTCAQECWGQFPKTVADYCNAPLEQILFCGMAIGYADTAHPVNQLKTKRLKTDQWLTIL